MASVGKLTIHVDTTEFDAAIEHIKATLTAKTAIVQAGWFARPMLRAERFAQQWAGLPYPEEA